MTNSGFANSVVLISALKKNLFLSVLHVLGLVTSQEAHDSSQSANIIFANIVPFTSISVHPLFTIHFHVFHPKATPLYILDFYLFLFFTGFCSENFYFFH